MAAANADVLEDEASDICQQHARVIGGESTREDGAAAELRPARSKSGVAGLRPQYYWTSQSTRMGVSVAVTFDDLVARARAVCNPRRLSDCADAGSVGAALLTATGNVYTGVCIDTACSMGFCAEHAAAAAMVTAGESLVRKMVAVDSDGQVLPPCGRCREFIRQLHDENLAADVLVGAGLVVKLSDLLPHAWR